MRVKFGVVGLCVAAIALTALGAPPVDAAQNQKKKAAATNRVATKAPPPRTRITVERRSFLDAGTAGAAGRAQVHGLCCPAVHVPKRDHREPGWRIPVTVAGTVRSAKPVQSLALALVGAHARLVATARDWAAQFN